MNQSPAISTTASEKKTKKGIGFSTILSTDNLKLEISTQGTVLRKTIYRMDQTIENNYYRVDDAVRVKQIESQSVNWNVRGGNSAVCPYFILEQRNAENKAIGCYKIVKKVKAETRGIMRLTVEASPENWTYYERRKGK